MVTLIGERREGGYLFVRCPELPGFSMMLAPNQYDHPETFTKAIRAPLAAFIAVCSGMLPAC